MNDDIEQQLESIFGNGVKDPGDFMITVGAFLLAVGFLMFIGGIIMVCIRKKPAQTTTTVPINVVGNPSAIAPVKYCPDCGRTLGMTVKYCYNCGHLFENAQR